MTESNSKGGPDDERRALVVPFPHKPWIGTRGPGPEGVGRVGVALFLVSLFMLFAALLVAHLWVRLSAPEWPPPGRPALPGVLWLSTALVIGLSACCETALRAVRANRQRRLRRALGSALLLALAFVGSQALAWLALHGGGVSIGSDLYGFTFYTLTGVHVAHILGGLIPLAFVWRRACAGRYDARSHRGVEYGAWYWHFLGAVWLVLFVSLIV